MASVGYGILVNYKLYEYVRNVIWYKSNIK